jgi:hypothetical protein
MSGNEKPEEERNTQIQRKNVLEVGMDLEGVIEIRERQRERERVERVL